MAEWGQLGCPHGGEEVGFDVAECLYAQADRDRVHYLNQTAALLLELCNGRNAEAQLPELVRLAYDLSNPPIEEVTQCLDTLRSEGLIL